MSTTFHSPHSLGRRRTLAALTVLAASTVLPGCGGGGDDTTSEAARVTDFWRRYFLAKSDRDATALAAQFADQVVYEDNSLQMAMAGTNAFIKQQWAGLFSFVPPDPRSVLKNAVGSMTGCAVELTNEAGLFTSVPIDGLSIVDMDGSRIVRITDYWDTTGIGDQEWAGLRAGFGSNPAWQSVVTGNHPTPATADASLASLVGRFVEACRAGDTAGAASCLASDARYWNRPLGIDVKGTSAITASLQKVLSLLPDGTGVSLTHVVGSDRGGGFEWLSGTADAGVLRGATEVEVAGGLITRLAVYYDGRLISQARRTAIKQALT